MKWLTLCVLVSVLGACVRPGGPGFSKSQPGINVAQAALAGGSPDLALSISDDILTNDPKNVGALLCRGDALVLLERIADADASYARVLTIDPGSDRARMGLGRLRLRTAPAQAEVLFLEVLRHEPHNGAALNDLGIAYDLEGNHVAAQDAYRRVLGVDPGMRAAEVNLAVSMALSGRAIEAVKILTQAVNEPDATRRTHHDLAVALALAGDRDGASRILSQDMTPEDVQLVLRGLEAFGT